mgnify:FL=1
MGEIKKEELLGRCDHTLLKVDSTWEGVRALIDEGIECGCASVCIPASFVAPAYEYISDEGAELPVCTVIGFPNGYSTTAVKCFEAADAVKNGASEIDMVINVGWVKEGRYDFVLDEINAVKAACDGRLLKVIIETCLLTDEEIIEMCGVVSESDADFIKTSTGFSTEGATFHAVELMKEHMTNGKKIKAAGGIATIDDAVRFVELGADRLGTSRLVKLFKEQ